MTSILTLVAISNTVNKKIGLMILLKSLYKTDNNNKNIIKSIELSLVTDNPNIFDIIKKKVVLCKNVAYFILYYYQT